VARTIANCAKREKVDLIVMGCRGLGEAEGLLLGSVSHKVVGMADYPVMTVRSPTWISSSAGFPLARPMPGSRSPSARASGTRKVSATLAAEVSLPLCRVYRERFGAVLRHNVDKILLRGGEARPAWGELRRVSLREVNRNQRGR
jgi:universal stress protein family protein/S-adenosylmethionine synthetase family protein